MKTTLSILTATTALAAFLAMPAVGAVHSGRTSDYGQLTAMDDAAPREQAYLVASNDDDDHRSKARYGSDDDDDDDDDDDHGGRASANPAPAGSVSPPNNSLFETGAASQVQVN